MDKQGNQTDEFILEEFSELENCCEYPLRLVFFQASRLRWMVPEWSIHETRSYQSILGEVAPSKII